MKLIPLIALSLTVLISTNINAQSDEANLQYILDRYVEAMGGRANLEQILSVRLAGKIQEPTGRSTPITVIKKKPNLVRIVIETKQRRVIQAYDGVTPWIQIIQGRNEHLAVMEGESAQIFVREAPLENALIHRGSKDTEIRLARDDLYQSLPCHVVEVTFPDGAITEFYLEKETMLERLIVEKDSSGKVLAELIPSRYETYGGVIFAMKLIRKMDGEVKSTLLLDDVVLNFGLIDTVFSPPRPINPTSE